MMNKRDYQIGVLNQRTAYALLIDIAKYTFLIAAFFVFQDLKMFIGSILVLQFISDHITIKDCDRYLDGQEEKSNNLDKVIRIFNIIISSAMLLLIIELSINLNWI